MLSKLEPNDYLFKLNFIFLIEIEAESLNNEEKIGNIVKPRTIQRLDGSTTNAISGAMLKHKYFHNVRMLTPIEDVCDSCKIYSPMKNGKIKNPDDKLGKSGNKVKNCVPEDLCGFVDLENGKNGRRESIATFSWAVAKEGYCNSSIHTRVDNMDNELKEKIKNESEINSKIKAQMIYRKSIRSSTYAVSASLDIGRIGLDDERFKYTIDKKSVKSRIKIALMALRNTFINIDGAMCSGNMPMLGNIKGVVTEKNHRNHITTKYSALQDDFIETNKELSSICYEYKNILEFNKTINRYLDDKFLDALIDRNFKYMKKLN